eukprot:4652921-Pyramimonas_sp.AAC.2
MGAPPPKTACIAATVPPDKCPSGVTWRLNPQRCPRRSEELPILCPGFPKVVAWDPPTWALHTRLLQCMLCAWLLSTNVSAGASAWKLSPDAYSLERCDQGNPMVRMCCSDSCPVRYLGEAIVKGPWVSWKGCVGDRKETDE